MLIIEGITNDLHRAIIAHVSLPRPKEKTNIVCEKGLYLFSKTICN